MIHVIINNVKRVLIVDDAIDLGRLLQDALKVGRPEIPITVVPSAEEALLEASRYAFDLLITDLRLPGMSGLDLVRKIRLRLPEIKVILISALDPEDRLIRQKEEVRPDVFIRKPISVAVFLDAVDDLMGAQPPASPPVEAPLPREEPLQARETVQPVDAAPSTAVPTAPEGIAPQAAKGPSPDVLAELEQVIPLPIPPPEQALPGGESVAGILDRLKAELGAVALFLVDEHGNSVALSGAVPDPALVEQLVPAAISSLSASVAVSYLVGAASAGSLQAFRGTEYDFLLAPAGDCSLLVLLKPGRSALRLAIAVEEVLAAQAELAPLLAAERAQGTPVEIAPAALQEMPERFGVTKSLPAEDIDADLEHTLLEKDTSLEKLEALFGENKPVSENPDTFWESAVGKGTGSLDHPSGLSYDQAQQLGLIKPDES